jgi:serine/threonine-protein phosphatase 2A regulatory subunit B''
MVDLLHPDKDIMFRMTHFKKQLTVCGVFFNFLTNLNKLVAYENRDPF